LGEDVEEQGDKWRKGEKIEKCNHCPNIPTQNVITVCIAKILAQPSNHQKKKPLI
jgi:hypothetical protein